MLAIAVVQDPGGRARTTMMAYDALGQVETAIDPVGQKTWTKYNNLGQPMIGKSKDQYGVV